MRSLSSGPKQKAIIVTGGENNEKKHKENELLKPDGTFWCKLPDFDTDRKDHTQNGLTTCGGPDTSYAAKTCVTLKGGAWTDRVNLKRQRGKHTSWSRLNGEILLIGGFFDRFPPSSVNI